MSGVALSPVRGIAWTRVPVLVPVLLVAGVLRLVTLGQVPFSMDESATAVFAGLSWDELLRGLGRLETNPPAFYVLEKLWTGLAGTSDWAFRVMPALSGVAGVAAVAVLARAAFGTRAGMWAGLLLATQAHHLGHSREARVYALLFLVIALAMLAARRVATWRDKTLPWRPAAALAVLSAVAMTLHYTGPVAAACVFVYAGVVAIHQAGPRLTRFAVLAVAGFSALAFATPSLIAGMALVDSGANSASWIAPPGWEMSSALVLSVLAVPLKGMMTLPVPLIGLWVILGTVVIGSAIGWGLRHAKSSADAAGMLAGLLSALVLLIGLSQAVPILLERTLLFSLVFFVPLMAAALAAMSISVRLAILAAVVLGQAPGLAVVLSTGQNGQGWQALAVTLQQDAMETGWPVVVEVGLDAAAIERYLPPGNPARPRIAITPQLGAKLSEGVARLATSAIPLPLEADSATFCRALGQPGGVLLVVHDTSPDSPRHSIASRLLNAAGGVLEKRVMLDRPAVERWSGVCSQVAAP